MAQKRTADYGHTETDKLLNEVENRISSTFMQAEMEMKKKLADWYAEFEKEDKEKAEKVSKGKLTQEEYIKWRQGQMRKGRRMEALADRLTQDFSNADKKAMEIVNGSTADVFALNANYAAYTIEDLTGQDIAWTLYDRSTVDRLMRNNPDLLPQPKVDIPKDKLWNRQHITNAITQGILQGESIPNIANRLQEVIGMDKRAAVRSARTATTGAECAGRVESYKHAKGMGIELQQEWLASLDNRTRHAHRELDGQKADVDEPFEIDGYKIKYPGDPSAPGYLVYNCRCTLIASLPGMSAGKRRAKDPITGKYEIIDGGVTYKEWEAKKKAQNPEAWDTYMKKGKNLSVDTKQYKKYKNVLGEEMPKTLAEFQNLKYNDPEKWKELQAERRETLRKNREILKEKIDSGELPLVVNKGKQRKHIQGTNEYKTYLQQRLKEGKTPQSVLTIQEEEIADIVKELATTGIVSITGNSDQNKKIVEYLDTGKIVGQYYQDNAYHDSTRIAIHYSKKGYHVVPVQAEVNNND